MNGFICLDKPQGITSFSAVKKVRFFSHEKKAGHTGTLDPMATGVLPVALGAATRFIELFETHDKSYEAKIRLGMTTDTLDITGTVLTETQSRVTEQALCGVLSHFVGKIRQLPPMYSAIKKDGVRLYTLARQGVEIEREEREVEIYSLTLLSFDEAAQEFTVSVSCSEGTYIRSLASDIGTALGVGATMTALRRTSALGFTLDSCVTAEQLEKMAADCTLEEALIRVEDAFSYEKIYVSDAQGKRFHNGGELQTQRLRQITKPCTYYRVYADKTFLGIGYTDAENLNLKVKRVYTGENEDVK